MRALLLFISATLICALAQNAKEMYGMRKVFKPYYQRVDYKDKITELLGGTATPPTLRLQTNPPDGYACSVCEMVLTSVSDYVKQHEATIPEALNALCDHFFAKDKTKLEICDYIITSQLKKIIELLEEGTDPKLTCKAIGVCSLIAA